MAETRSFGSSQPQAHEIGLPLTLSPAPETVKLERVYFSGSGNFHPLVRPF